MSSLWQRIEILILPRRFHRSWQTRFGSVDVGRDSMSYRTLPPYGFQRGIDSVVFPSATGTGRNVAVYLANAIAGSVVVRNRAEVLAALRRPRVGKRGR